jgi:type I restriction enzyme M protein
MFEQAFKNIDDVLRKEADTTELDYTEQTSWLLFLKYLDGLEQDRADEAALEVKEYTYILDKPHRWESWAAPKGKDGKLDHNKALTGDDLRDFVNEKLFPHLHGFKQKASGPNTIEYKIGEIFGEIKNKIQSGYNLREIIDHIDDLRFRSQTEKHELSHLYEAKIKNMGNAGRNGGEYYTPRPLIRAIVQVTKPKRGKESTMAPSAQLASCVNPSLPALNQKSHHQRPQDASGMHLLRQGRSPSLTSSRS